MCTVALESRVRIKVAHTLSIKTVEHERKKKSKIYESITLNKENKGNLNTSVYRRKKNRYKVFRVLM